MKHENKAKKARRMMSNKEIKEHINIFDSMHWKEHKEAVKKRVQKREEHLKRLAEVRKNEKNY